jgi:hypothetical protein
MDYRKASFMEINKREQITEECLTSLKSKTNSSTLITHTRSVCTFLLPPNIGSEMTSINTSVAYISLLPIAAHEISLNCRYI